VRLSEICIQRPVFAFMLVLFMTVTGIVSFLQLGVDLFPRSDPATVFVRVQLPGASPEEVTSQVIMPLEEAIASVSGIDEMRARVSEGSGNVIVTFSLDRDIGEATEDVREKVAGAVRNFPPNARPPVVQKSDPDNEPIVTVAISGQRSVRDLTEIADKQIRRALETVDGVAAVDISGARNRQINVFLDLNKLNGYEITAQDVERALQTENVEAPGGRIVRGTTEVGVRTLGRMSSVSDFNDIIIKNVGGSPVRVRDIGRVEDGMTEKRSFAYVNQTPAVIMEVRRQMGTNTVKVAEGIQTRLNRLRSEIPAGVKLDVLREQASFIKASVSALEEHLLLGAIFASFVVWLFLREWRAVFISSLAIPTSIITTFTLMRAMDFTLNSMTLLGLTLAVGIVIDDAIIVLENIYRHIEENDLPPMVAAVRATREIALAVMATTISLVIIFVPIAFMTGYAKRYLNQFGWTMAFSILVSMLVAFTLTPTLSARLLRKRTNGKGHGHGAHRGGPTDRAYAGMLNWSLDHRWAIVLIALVTLGSTFVVYRYIGRDWMPQEDQNELGINLELPAGTSIAELERVTLEMASRVAKVDGVLTVIPTTGGRMGGGGGSSSSNTTVLLKDVGERGPILEMGAKVRQVLRPYAYARPRVSFPNTLGGRDTFVPIRAQLLGPDMDTLTRIAKETNGEMVRVPSVSDMRVSLSLSNPELQVKIDRTRASDLGVRTSDIAGAVRLLMSGEDEISTFKEGSEQYPVTMRLNLDQRDDPNVLSRIMIPSARLGMIRLDSIARLERGFGPASIDRLNRQFTIGIFGNVAPGYSLNQAADETRAAIERVGLPIGYDLLFSGQVKILEETTMNMLMALTLAAVFVYMVLAAQFESLLHPLIILASLPLAIPFALISLIATGRTLNLFSALGVLLLFGIVKKNAILLVDYTNRVRAQGLPLRDSILLAARVRLRPILMTTFAIVAGLIPTALGIGAGAQQRSAIAVTIIGGQTLCLILTLLVVPVGYSLVEGMKARLAARHPQAEPAPATGD
jgi:hydrophobic/amphiphilic exporter-1 (mainly G- bacteria), HAE1 family